MVAARSARPEKATRPARDGPASPKMARFRKHAWICGRRRLSETFRALILPFERQAEDELAVHRHHGIEVETDVVVDRRHVAPGALQWMTMLQAAAAGGVEDQVDRRLRLVGDERLTAPAEQPYRHRRFAILPNLRFCGVDCVPRHQPAGVD